MKIRIVIEYVPKWTPANLESSSKDDLMREERNKWETGAMTVMHARLGNASVQYLLVES